MSNPNKKNRNGFVKVGQVLTTAAKKYNLEQAVFRHQTLKHWDSVVSTFFDDAAGKTKALDLKDGVLVVACLCRDLAYQIKTLASRIIYMLNQLIGKTVVFSLVVLS